ncbi:glycosyl hydrolase [Litoribaculum gwangyangense]|uniref:GH26 domain-containing protein n=1 Tax=Litoribaculum gwangyangense TaxID=1130722 RepID=A0ABP9CLG3_9FLAO
MYSRNSSQSLKTRFEPENGECLFFIGQDLKAIGGLENYNDGYCNYFEIPAGITLYTNFSPGDESFGYYLKGNDGIKTIANWGAEDSCAECFINNNTFNNTMIAIGLSIVNHEKKVANGNHDNLIKELGNWIKSINRPVFLRIGYEFDGWEWNNYNKKHYLMAWQHIHNMFKDMDVNNVAFVWQSKGSGSNQEVLEDWYPGDDLVDWCGYSYFGNPDQEMLVFARKHNKPVFIAEATPVMEDNGLFFDTCLGKPKIAKKVWDAWFVPFINTLNSNKDVIKAFSYINVNWSAQPMWKNNPVFKKVDSRIQVSDYISKKWLEEINKPRYLKSSPHVFKKIYFTH